MGSITVGNLLTKAQTILQDPDGTRWPKAELVGWINSAYVEIIAARPDANSESATLTCKEGARQDLTETFPQAQRLLDITRNMAGDQAPVGQIERDVLDTQLGNWFVTSASDSVEYYMFNPKLPREFLVYPPATKDAQLEVVFSSVPENHDPSGSGVDSETIKLSDTYANVILDYTLYRAFSKDAEYAANAQRAAAYYEAMQSALGVKAKTDNAANPRDVYPAATK